MDRLAIGCGFHRVALAHPDARCDRHIATPAHGSPDATPDREADTTPDREADTTPNATPNAAVDCEAHVDAAAAEQTRPARLADE